MPPKSFSESKRLLGEVSKIALTCLPGRARVRSSPELQRQEYRWGKWWGYSRRSRRASLGKRDSLRASPCSGVAGTPGRPSKTCCKNTCPKTSSGIYQTPLMITSADISTGGVHVFKSRYLGDLGEPYERDGDVLLREAILASCAAPTYFDPKAVGPYLLTDGGLWANNPSIIALTEAISKFKKGVEEVTNLFYRHWTHDNHVHKTGFLGPLDWVGRQQAGLIHFRDFNPRLRRTWQS